MIENIQDSFLTEIQKDGIVVTVFLMNGFQMKGIILGFDDFSVVLSSEGKQNLIYKHAISTIQPLHPASSNLQGQLSFKKAEPFRRKF